MNRKYIFPALLLLVAGIILVLLPERDSHDDLSPGRLLTEITGDSRFLATETIADRMVQRDPSQVLIDVRTAEEFQHYALPGAVNIPLQEIMGETWQEFLSQDGYDFTFYSNDDILADRAWILSKRAGHRNIYVMKGGLNQWFEDFFTSSSPVQTQTEAEYDLHLLRQGIRQFLTGGNAPVAEQATHETITVKPRTKKSKAEGGC